MYIETTATSVRMQEGSEQVAALRSDATEDHIAEHIRGMVAATMGNLSAHASDASRIDAEQWQQWALGLADGLTMPVAG